MGHGNWSKAGGFGEDTPNRKCYLELELEQSRWIWRRYSKPEMLLRAGIGAKPVDMEKMLQTGKVCLALELEQSKRIRKIAPILEGKQKIDMEQ